MALRFKHLLVSGRFACSVETVDEVATVKCLQRGEFRVRFPGPIHFNAKATFKVRTKLSGPGAKPFSTKTENLPIKVTIRTPDGKEFNNSQVTLQDLARFRDMQGVTRNLWRYEVAGQSKPIAIDGGGKILEDAVNLHFFSEETIESQSGAPLLDAPIAAAGTQQFSFDLHRIGTFEVKVSDSALLPSGAGWRGKLILKDPDGIAVATSSRDRLEFPVTLVVLEKSRGSSGEVRNWTLEATTDKVPAGGGRIRGEVVTTTRIAVKLLNDRISSLLSDTLIFGENSEGRAKVKLKFLSPFAAETVDMHGVLDGVLEDDPDDIADNVAYTLASMGSSFSIAKIDVSSFKVKSISVLLGASKKIKPSIPALSLQVKTEGKIHVLVPGFPNGSAALAGGSLAIEVGLRLEAGGSFVADIVFPDKLVDLDGVGGAAELVEGKINEFIRKKLGKAIQLMIAGGTPRILAIFNGTELTYRAIRLDGDDILFEYLAPIEPTQKPAKNYAGVIGRSVTPVADALPKLKPASLGDTWEHANLTKKIKNIVVVMMENRSFDHVLGHRAQLPESADSKGLSTQLLADLTAELQREKLISLTSKVPKLAEAGFAIKTQFPVPVGHHAEDVTEQLSRKMKDSSQREINSPVGFVKNFQKNLKGANAGKAKPEDVVGYYEAADLPFFKFLAENYAYCEDYYCSHPGPTLPNRMFSLAGDLQFDRTGEALIENNNSDDFFLSRATNIFDVLTRKGVPWRVYESFPSVAMLRMFARYAANDTDIVPISRLAKDIKDGLPPVTIIEPAMHHFPPTDDHPVADMCNGQNFLANIYKLLSASKQWENTLLIVTYDEHGGFYDHVIPPVADLRSRGTSKFPSPAPPAPGVPPTKDKPTVSTLLTPYGVRVPTFVVSPWARAGGHKDLVFDHCSILKTILACFCGDSQPFLSDRVEASRSFDALLSEATPRLKVPKPAQFTCQPPVDPTPGNNIVTPVVSRKQMRQGQVDYHDLTGMLGRLLGRK